jgi:hypothetical protein
MNIGNVASDGYGLHHIEIPNLPTNGYGVGVDLGFSAVTALRMRASVFVRPKDESSTVEGIRA